MTNVVLDVLASQFPLPSASPLLLTFSPLCKMTAHRELIQRGFCLVVIFQCLLCNDYKSSTCRMSVAEGKTDVSFKCDDRRTERERERRVLWPVIKDISLFCVRR